MTLSVLILTRNRQEELTQCLSSLKREFEECLEVIVLDNGSEPPLKRTDFAQFPQLKILRSDKNLGVAEGRNMIAQKARGELLWFLDDDAVLETSGVYDPIKKYFENPALGVLSFKVINQFTGKEETRCIPDRRKKSTKQDLPSAYFVGCSFVIQKKAFFEVGGFCERLFYSCEELDLSYRLLDLKYTLIRSSLLKVKHAYSPCRARASSWIYFNTRNRFWTAIRNLPLRYVISQACFWWGYTGWVSLRQKQLKFWCSGLWDSLKGAETAFRERKVISKTALQTVASLGGRTWY